MEYKTRENSKQEPTKEKPPEEGENQTTKREEVSPSPSSSPGSPSPESLDKGEFNREYQAFLKEKKERAAKKEKRKKNRWKKWLVVLVLVAFLAGVVVDGHYRIYDRTLEAWDTLVSGQASSGDGADSGFQVNQGDKPPLVGEMPASPGVAITKKVLPSVVAIQSTSDVVGFWGQRSQRQGTGSGFFIDSSGLIVTNDHVITEAEKIQVLYEDELLDASLVGSDPMTDIAVIKVEGKGYPSVDFGDSSALQVGELVLPMGSPVGIDFAGSVTQGIVSGLDREVYLGDKTMTLIQTDAAINPGNSGGPLVNAAGQVVGINVLKFADASVEGMSFSIPINEARPIIESLVDKGEVIRPGIGIRGRDVSPQEAEEFDVPLGILVVELMPGGGAQEAGMETGDIITSYEGQELTSMDALIGAIQEGQVGDEVTVTVYRKGQTIDLTVTLSQR